MKYLEQRHTVSCSPIRLTLPWWYRPSFFLLGVTLPSLVLLHFSDTSWSQSDAQLIYGYRDFIVGLLAIAILAAGAVLGESKLLPGLAGSLLPRRRNAPPREWRLAEAFLSPRFDWLLMAIFLASHVLFFRVFYTNPSIAMAILQGNVEVKHTLETIPGVTTWTQVSLLLGAIRGLRWAGILPGRVKLISVFHLVFFGVLFVRALLWSERLALIEGGLPFFLCAFPRLVRDTPKALRIVYQLLPLFIPFAILFFFTAFEMLRSWQYYSAYTSDILQFGIKRLYTYYFEAMNTGAATLGVSGFYDGVTGPMGIGRYVEVYKGLYAGTLDKEYNNTSGIWYAATRTGNVLFVPVFFIFGTFAGATWRSFSRGRLFGLFFPVVFLGLMEIIRIGYWIGTTRVLPTTLLIVILLAWAALIPGRVRVRPASATASRGAATPPESAEIHPQTT